MEFPSNMSRRECEIAGLIATGASNKEIARELGISIRTVKNILTKVYEKTETRSRTELAVRLIQSQYRHPAFPQRSFPLPSLTLSSRNLTSKAKEVNVHSADSIWRLLVSTRTSCLDTSTVPDETIFSK